MGSEMCIRDRSSAARIARTYDERSVDAIVDAALSGNEEVSISSGFANVASSGGLTFIALQAVPNEHDFFRGRLKVNEALGIIPFGRFFFGDKSSAVRYRNTSEWLTWYTLGPNSSWGVGTNLVADLYLDFGPGGVVAGMFLLGIILGVIKRKSAAGSSLLVLVLYCYFAGLLAILPRYSFLVIMRAILWPLALLIVIGFFAPKKSHAARLN